MRNLTIIPSITIAAIAQASPSGGGPKKWGTSARFQTDGHVWKDRAAFQVSR